MRFHIHIYQVEKKAEININADDSETALRAALKEKETLSYQKSDCHFIAMEFENGNKMMDNLLIEKEKSHG